MSVWISAVSSMPKTEQKQFLVLHSEGTLTKLSALVLKAILGDAVVGSEELVSVGLMDANFPEPLLHFEELRQSALAHYLSRYTTEDVQALEQPLEALISLILRKTSCAEEQTESYWLFHDARVRLQRIIRSCRCLDHCFDLPLLECGYNKIIRPDVEYTWQELDVTIGGVGLLKALTLAVRDGDESLFADILSRKPAIPKEMKLLSATSIWALDYLLSGVENQASRAWRRSCSDELLFESQRRHEDAFFRECAEKWGQNAAC